MSTKTARMKEGDTVTVLSGEFRGMTGTIVNPKPVPDVDENGEPEPMRRKILVEINDQQVYILPRMVQSAGATVTPLHVGERRIDEVNTITDLDDGRLDPYRPDAEVVARYVSRQIPNGDTDVKYLLDHFDRRQNVLLVGETQSGKTMLVNVLAVQAAIRMGKTKPLPVFTLSGSSGVSDFDLFGQTTAWTDPETGVERLVWLPGVVDLACRVGGILYLDEINMMNERTTSSLHPVCDYRRMFINRQRAVKVEGDGFMPEVVNASEDLWVVGTMNPAGYRGAGALNEAFTNRFSWVPWNYDERVEEQLIPSPTVRQIATALRNAREQRAISTPVGTASLERLCADALRYGVDTALWSFYAMFQPNEIGRVKAVITDRTFDMQLREEVREARNQAKRDA